MVPKLPPPLIDYLCTDRCVLFVGSGLSAAGKLPTWTTLLEDMVNEVSSLDMIEPVLVELNELLKAGKLLEVAYQCKESLGEQRYSAFLSEKLRADKVDIPAPHKIISQLPFSAIITTNYDKLLERTYTERVPKVLTHQQIEAQGTVLFDGSFFILKAHGDIDDPSSLILTAGDYSDIIHSNQAFNSLFSAILLTKAILFVGYSLNDPDFRLLIDRQLTIFNRYIPPRYALMSGVGIVERAVLKQTAGIHVLSYEKGNHEESQEFLQNLLEAVNKKEPTLAIRASKKESSERTLSPVAQSRAEIAPITLSIRLSGLSGSRQVRSTLIRDSLEIAIGSNASPDWAKISLIFREWDDEKVEGPKNVGMLLAGCLPGEVLNALQNIPAEQVIKLKLSAELETLPWEWMDVGGQHLFLRNPVVRAPISVSDKARGYPLISKEVRVLLIGDTMKNLPNTKREVEDIANLYRQHSIRCEILTGTEATYDRVGEELQNGDYNIVHFSGVSVFDVQGSLLGLANEDFLRDSELRSLFSKQPPAIMMFNAQYTAFIPPGVRGDENTTPKDGAAGTIVVGQAAFTEIALVSGVGAFIGCFHAPSDQVARTVGVKFHEELLKGHSVAKAIYNARHRIKQEQFDDLSFNDLSWAKYIVSGYGELALPSAL